MPSFLVTKNMPPALRVRVEAALEADLRQRLLFPRKGRARKYLRAALASMALCLLAYLAVTYRQSREEVERVRADILAEYRSLAARAPAQARSRLRTLSQQMGLRHQEDPKEYGSRADLEALLRRPLLYVRGDAERMSTPRGSEDTARESSVDALVTCLLSPPANLRESTLLRAIGQAPASGHAASFADAAIALDFFDSTFEGQVRTAEHMQELQNLAARLHRPRMTSALSALEAEVLLVAIDEPKAPGVVSDFDGEAPHDIAVMALELQSGRLLWRRQLHVDPAWISEKSRLAYSRALDSCRLAYELRQKDSANGSR